MKKNNRIKNIGSNIKLERINQGLALQELAAKAGIHKKTLSHIERGIVNTSIDKIYRIALVLNIDIVDLCKSK